MNKAKITKTNNKLVLLTLLAYLIPVIVLSSFGLYAIFDLDLMIYVLGGLSVFTGLLFLIKKNYQQSLENEVLISYKERELAEISQDWSAKETQIWQDCVKNIDLLVSKDSEWEALKPHTVAVAQFIAVRYERKELDLTILESLRAIEEVSRRFRKAVKEHLPAQEYIKLSHLKFGYDFYDGYAESGKTIYQVSNNVFRLGRALASPLQSIVSEFKDYLMKDLSSGAYENLTLNIKRMYLKEVASVCIDLYSGRLSFDPEELQASQVQQKDKERAFKGLEPIRVAVVGQVSAGKSSLINRLKKDVVSDVDIVPVTTDIKVFDFKLEDESAFSLVDLPGLDGSQKVKDLVLEQMMAADLIIWVLKVKQSARKLDTQLMNEFDSLFEKQENISKKKPYILGVLNQIDGLVKRDQLVSETEFFSKETEASSLVKDVIDYNQSILNYDGMVVTVLKDDKDCWGLVELEKAFSTQLAVLKSTQLNRQRLDTMNRATELKSHFRRLFKGTAKVINSSLRG